ncbi:hypothetical protein LL965_21045 [Xanthomonas cassavae CFBP 4642]|uniref:DUF2390 domain-containing protein n=1 Tax=Xanthomonas cassavae CFBP 4642 TaxID=1219375 RepID=A0ABS8HLB8_9XANT|nr:MULTISPECIES: hypothetical protein [Xanthomonas]MCC4622422.1 hypothetical protein [Xanthomonas cassavae CFBP 4642]
MAFVDAVRNILGALDDYWERIALRLEIWGFKPFQAAVLIAWMIAHQRDGKTSLSEQDAALLRPLEDQLVDAMTAGKASAEAQQLHSLLPTQFDWITWDELRKEALGIDPRPTVLAYLFAAYLRGELTRANLRKMIKAVQASMSYG